MTVARAMAAEVWASCMPINEASKGVMRVLIHVLHSRAHAFEGLSFFDSPKP